MGKIKVFLIAKDQEIREKVKFLLGWERYFFFGAITNEFTVTLSNFSEARTLKDIEVFICVLDPSNEGNELDLLRILGENNLITPVIFIGADPSRKQQIMLIGNEKEVVMIEKEENLQSALQKLSL
ncbi:MAG: hypothetical protein WDK96_02290 [Candidatus Paceibacterota bacterium]|jgi:hypothetical protein